MVYLVKYAESCHAMVKAAAISLPVIAIAVCNHYLSRITRLLLSIIGYWS